MWPSDRPGEEVELNHLKTASRGARVAEVEPTLGEGSAVVNRRPWVHEIERAPGSPLAARLIVVVRADFKGASTRLIRDDVHAVEVL